MSRDTNINLLGYKCGNLTFGPNFILAKNGIRRFANEKCDTTAVVQTSAYRRWHRRGFSRVCPIAANPCSPGRWATGGQLNNGHLLLQDDQTVRYVSACWTSAAQFQPTASCSHTNAHSMSLLGEQTCGAELIIPAAAECADFPRDQGRS